MEEHRCKIAAVGVEDSRCQSLVDGAVVEMEDQRCNFVEMRMEDPRCSNLHARW